MSPYYGTFYEKDFHYTDYLKLKHIQRIVKNFTKSQNGFNTLKSFLKYLLPTSMCSFPEKVKIVLQTVAILCMSNFYSPSQYFHK